MAFSTLAGINAALPGQRIDYTKAQTSPGSSPFWMSLWAAGGRPAAGATPSSGLGGDVPTSSTTGAIPFVNPASGNTYLARLEMAGATANNASGTIALYDRLWHNSGISATSTSGQTISSVALDRPDANGTGAEAWWHVYATMGSGTPIVTLTYTNSGNTGSRTGTSGTLATTMAANRTGQFTMDSGDVGVKSIQTWQADATFTSGTIDLVIRRQITMLWLNEGVANTADAIGIGLPRILNNACLEVLYLGITGSGFTPAGQLHLVQG